MSGLTCSPGLELEPRSERQVIAELLGRHNFATMPADLREIVERRARVYNIRQHNAEERAVGNR